MKTSIKQQGQLRKQLPLLLIGLSVAFTTWVLWRPLIEVIWVGGSPVTAIKDWGLSDQLSYLAISRNVQDGMSPYVEPFTETGTSIYPATYYWFLGLVANATNTSVFFAWNVVGLVATVAASVLSAVVAIQLTGRRWAGAIGALVLLVGNLQWLINRHWMQVFGEHAVLWPPFVNLFNPAAEVVGMTLLLGALCAWLRASRGSDFDVKYIALTGFLVGVGFNFHIYTTLFGAATVAFVMLVWHLVSLPSRVASSICAVSMLAAVIVVFCFQGSSPLVLFGVWLIGAVAPVVLVPKWRKHSLKSMLILGVTGVVAGLPAIVRIARDVLSPDSFMSYRAADAQGRHLSLPVENVVVYSWPLLALAISAGVLLVRERNDPAKATWFASVVGVLIASILLVFNSSWGMDQEPYRFYPYACLLIAALSIPWLVSVVAVRRHKALSAVLSVFFLLTVPSTVAFARDSNTPVATFSDEESQLYRQIAEQLPSGLVMLDSCIPSHAFKIATGARVLDASVGLALPDHSVELRRVKQSQIEGRLSSNEDLARAGAGSIVLASHCKSIPKSDIESRFGSPLAIVRQSCSGGPQYSIYSIDPKRQPKLVSRIDNFSEARPLEPATNPPESCGLTAPLVKPSPSYEKQVQTQAP